MSNVHQQMTNWNYLLCIFVPKLYRSCVDKLIFVIFPYYIGHVRLIPISPNTLHRHIQLEYEKKKRYRSVFNSFVTQIRLQMNSFTINRNVLYTWTNRFANAYINTTYNKINANTINANNSQRTTYIHITFTKGR